MSEDPKTKYPAPGKNEKPQSYPGLEAAMVTKPEYGKGSYRGSGKLEGKAALVTGGDSGIGRAVAVAFAREGADVAIAYLPEEEEDARETVAQIEAAGRKAAAFPGDLRDEAYARGLVDHAKEALGALDILVNNAGLQAYFKKLEDIVSEDFTDTYYVNVVAPFFLSRDASHHMRAGGSIINTVSVEAYEPDSLLLPYAASKGGLLELTRALSKELIGKGIRVNAVAPGPIWSPLNTHGSPPGKLEKFGESSAIGRPGQPIELSPVYVLLASDAASYITGEVYGITGGEGIA